MQLNCMVAFEYLISEENLKLQRLIHILFIVWKMITVKPVCNDHLYDKIYYLWLIQ